MMLIRVVGPVRVTWVVFVCVGPRSDEETDSEDSYSVESSSSSDNPPDDVGNKRLWRIHAKLLRKAGLRTEHATNFKLQRVTDIGHGMLNRLPRAMPGRETRWVQTYKPLPKNEVIAFLMDIMAEPRGRGMKCLHGTDTDGYTKRLHNFKPERERRKAAGASACVAGGGDGVPTCQPR